MKFTKTIEALRVEAATKIAEADRLQRLLDEFPDLQQHTNRWNRIRYTSKSVNARAADFDSGHNCGCCPDSPLEIWPVLETPNGKVYSDPPVFQVGERNAYTGNDEPYSGWDQRMRDTGISEALIERVRLLFGVDEDAEIDE